MKDVEALGKKLGYSTVNKNFHNVSLGQGQETVAEDAMAIAARGIHEKGVYINTCYVMFHCHVTCFARFTETVMNRYLARLLFNFLCIY